MQFKKAPITLILHIALVIIIAGACVTHWAGKHGSIQIAYNQAQERWLDTNDKVQSLPFALRLDSCSIEYYPATTAPKDYASFLTAIFADGREQRCEVRMNHALSVEGYRFCQSGMGTDYTVLTVCHDPWGIAITYAGYFLLFFTLAAFFFQRKGNGFRALLSSPLLKRGVSVVLGLLCGFTAFASGPKAIDPIVAETFGELYVYNGSRVEPMQSMAREFCLQVYGKHYYGRYSAEQVLLGWVLDYDAWKREPMIRVKGKDVKQALGVKGDYACLTDFFGPEGYKVDPLLCDFTNTNAQRTNERVQLVVSVCRGQALLIYPYYSALGRMEWLSWVDARPSKMPLEQWTIVSTSMGDFAREVAMGDDDAAIETIRQIREYQVNTCAEAGEPLSEGKFMAEAFYNRISQPIGVFVVLFLFGIVGLLGLLASGLAKCGRVATAFALAVGLTWTTAELILRAYIAGHWPLSNGPETMQFLAWCALLLGCILGKKFPVMAPAGVLIAAFALLVSAIGGSSVISNLLPVLSSPLLSVHVMVIMLSYALLGMIAVISAIGLCKKTEAERLAVVTRIMLYPAVFLLATGIFLGAIWANCTWGRYWGWDPKETWALITMCIYAVPLHWIALKPFRNPKVLHIYLLCAFASVLMTYFGVNFFLGGLHSYA